MAQFKDRNGVVWSVDVNVNQVKRLRTELDVNLLEVLTDGQQVIQRLVDDPVLLVDTLYVLCRYQADEKGITDEQFGVNLVGDAIQDATAALMEAIADFFPTGRRDTLRAVVAKIRKAQEASEARAMKILSGDSIDTAISRQLDEAERRLQEELEGIGGGLSTS